jgi:hypothetical protein
LRRYIPPECKGYLWTTWHYSPEDSTFLFLPGCGGTCLVINKKFDNYTSVYNTRLACRMLLVFCLLYMQEDGHPPSFSWGNSSRLGAHYNPMNVVAK